VDQPSVRRQVNGFGSGVRIACTTCKAYGVYAGTFDANAKLSATAGALLKDKKVSVVFNAASIFGTMTLKNLTTQVGTYGIGSGSDEWITNWAYGSVPGSEHILTSIQTDYSVMVRSVMESVLHANLTGGSTVFYGVNPDPKQSAIKLAPVHEAEGVFTKEIQKKMEGYVADMARGKLTTGVDHKSGESRNSGECKCPSWPLLVLSLFCALVFFVVSSPLCDVSSNSSCNFFISPNKRRAPIVDKRDQGIRHEHGLGCRHGHGQ